MTVCVFGSINIDITAYLRPAAAAGRDAARP